MSSLIDRTEKNGERRGRQRGGEKDRHLQTYFTACELTALQEKRGLREMRVLENLKNMIHEANEHTLPRCRETVQGSLSPVLRRLQTATNSVCRLQQREQERRKIHNDHLITSEKQHVIQWENFMKEQHNKQAEVDEEHRKAMEKLKEQYAQMEKDLAKFSTF
ncbi:biogenesis of lysosome-related organelles complex 1 subunit 5 isoform X2 [Erinaceus europaeus]|uniref:Biogenesis of lysosome-related organelles complex 1 subunit 5 n=1 Tax=Erinaceus europaeus TaxID=9365 RepID=A0ABM3X8M2_ERIEU|nr:biogenesis of lysosome-related organelles complex 1 subunit 5 isoform X2 [Erinaceus europaeus]